LVPPENLWIPVTIFAAFAQTIRNATQKHLTASLGTLGATLVRFLYGLPFAALWLLAVRHIGEFAYPSPNWKFGAWILLGAVGQIGGTALLLRVIKERNFTLGVAYAKTEALQVALFGFVFLGDPILPAVLKRSCKSCASGEPRCSLASSARLRPPPGLSLWRSNRSHTCAHSR
jgi:drug/metabolite transporter (DMT)-like permease